MAEFFTRCCDAYDTACCSIAPDDYDESDHRVAMAAVLRVVAAEILERHHRASARQVAQMLLQIADGLPVPAPEPDDDEPLDWRDHPSLTHAERNR